jgi:hypothetical protein
MGDEVYGWEKAKRREAEDAENTQRWQIKGGLMIESEKITCCHLRMVMVL